MRNQHTICLCRNMENIYIRYSREKSFLCRFEIDFRLSSFQTSDDPGTQVGVS